MHQVFNFIVLTITTTKDLNAAYIKSIKLHISLFVANLYTISRFAAN